MTFNDDTAAEALQQMRMAFGDAAVRKAFYASPLPGIENSDIQPPTSVNQTLELLADAVQAHFHALWKEQGEPVDDTVIVSWMVPIFYREFGGISESFGYSVESSQGMATHEMRGLLVEADNWITDRVIEEDD